MGARSGASMFISEVTAIERRAIKALQCEQTANYRSRRRRQPSKTLGEESSFCPDVPCAPLRRLPRLQMLLLPEQRGQSSPFPVSHFRGAGCGERTHRTTAPWKHSHTPPRSPPCQGLSGEEALSYSP